ncbi:hypothetical protein BH09BAC3_BH09BAC3_29070 [soil metagenome]
METYLDDLAYKEFAIDRNRTVEIDFELMLDLKTGIYPIKNKIRSLDQSWQPPMM